MNQEEMKNILEYDPQLLFDYYGYLESIKGEDFLTDEQKLFKELALAKIKAQL